MRGRVVPVVVAAVSPAAGFTTPPVKAGDIVADTTIFDGRIVYERHALDANLRETHR